MHISTSSDRYTVHLVSKLKSDRIYRILFVLENSRFKRYLLE